MMTQNESILRHLREGKKITPVQALMTFGCFRLASRVAELKEQGVPIESEWTTNRDGARFKRYYLKK